MALRRTTRFVGRINDSAGPDRGSVFASGRKRGSRGRRSFSGHFEHEQLHSSKSGRMQQHRTDIGGSATREEREGDFSARPNDRSLNVVGLRDRRSTSTAQERAYEQRIRTSSSAMRVFELHSLPPPPFHDWIEFFCPLAYFSREKSDVRRQCEVAASISRSQDIRFASLAFCRITHVI